MDYLIRDCHKNDLPTLIRLCQKHADFERTFYNPQGKERLLSEALFSECPKLFCLIVEVNQQAVGYASYTIDFSTWNATQFLYLDCLYLEPDFRGIGIGEVILNKLKNIAVDRGCPEIQWQTPVFNEGAIRFYKRVGAIGNEKVRFSLTPDILQGGLKTIGEF